MVMVENADKRCFCNAYFMLPPVRVLLSGLP